MVTEWGMSAEIGPMFLGGSQEVFLGRDYGHTTSSSEQFSARVDEEVRKILEHALTEAKRALTEKRDGLEAVAQALLEHEKLTGDQFRRLLEEGPDALKAEVADAVAEPAPIEVEDLPEAETVETLEEE